MPDLIRHPRTPSSRTLAPCVHGPPIKSGVTNAPANITCPSPTAAWIRQRAFSALELHGPPPPPQTPPLPRLAPGDARGRFSDRRLFRRRLAGVGRSGAGLVRGAARGAGRRCDGLGDRNRTAAGALRGSADGAAPAGKLYQ